MQCPLIPLVAVDINESNASVTLGGLAGILVTLVPVVWVLIRARDGYRDLLREHLQVKQDIANLKAKVDTVWNAQLTRGKIEGERSGHMVFAAGSRNISADSFQLSLDAWQRFGPIRQGLRSIAMEMPNSDDSMLTMVIERRYGRWIVENICRVLGVHDMSCLLMAAKVARSNDEGSSQVFRPAEETES